jgi:hypothetical protein
MRTSCPACSKPLSLADNLAGKRVRCPACKEVFPVPMPEEPAFDQPASTDISDAPMPVRATAPAAVKKGPPPLESARRTCPECGALLTADAFECTQCDWTSERARDAHSEQGRLYLLIRNDETDLNEKVAKRLDKLLETEQLDMRIMSQRDRPPEELGPNDLLISGEVTVFDYGSQFMRYFLGIIAMLGPGSCKLSVDVDVETAGNDVRRIQAHGRKWFGIFGGSGTELMKQNIAEVSSKIATGAIRHMTGNSFLNAQAYSCAGWSLGLGLASLIPFIGIIFAAIAFVQGLIAFTTISRRQLPRGKGMALAGLVFSFLGLLVSAGVIAFLVLRKK